MSTIKYATLSTTAKQAIVHTFVDALNQADNTGSLVTQVCDTAQKYLKGDEMSVDDTNGVVNAIAKQRGWKGPSLKSRTSEVRVVLRASAVLPEAIKAYADKANKCDWHTAMRLARCINKGEPVQKAVKSTFSQKATQSPKSTPQGRTAGALKAWYKDAKGDKRALIIKAAEMLGIKLGIKVEA